ncbi:glycerophosphodiester phosphodiesterase 1 isoform X2 [Anticarsia gemmatalis]|uniref:glycerophosphodiester phosphodiesterase 1 isoform X2 n=1 Tax=Anticarsia gemmatalis TaxID=129554 RepID=UPI003F75E387
MSLCVTRTAWLASGATLRPQSIYPRIALNALACYNPKNSIILDQRRSLFILPYGLDVGLLGVTTYFMSKLKKPDPLNVISIFGPEPGTKESQDHPEKVVRCIAHRGAGLDAPENTLEAFKYCVSRDCNMVELDVRSSKDGMLVLLHDQGLQRLTGSSISNVHVMDWDKIKNIDVGSTHPNRKQYKEVYLCLLDEALDYLLENKVRVIIDVKGEDKQIISGILNTFASRPALYEYAAVTCFNPFVLYQIRKRDPQIVGALSYRPYCFSAQDYDAENGPTNPRFGNNLAIQSVLRGADMLHSLLWRWTARWCNVSAVLLHKDIVAPSEVQFWRSLGIRCAGWCVNRPLEKLYWRGVLKAPYLANTLLGEPEVNAPAVTEVEKRARDNDNDFDRAGPLIDRLLEPERRMSSGQN